MLNGPDAQEEHVLDDGTHVSLRKIRPGDAAELRRGFDRLSPSSRYRRFLASRNTLSDETLRYLTCVDGHDHVAIVAVGHGDDGTEVGLGIARFIRLPEDPATPVIMTFMGDPYNCRLSWKLYTQPPAHGRQVGEIFLLGANAPNWDAGV